MGKFDTKTKKQRKEEEQVKVRLVPFERYIYEGIIAISNTLTKMQKDIDTIKERLTFEASKDKK